MDHRISKKLKGCITRPKYECFILRSAWVLTSVGIYTLKFSIYIGEADILGVNFFFAFFFFFFLGGGFQKISVFWGYVHVCGYFWDHFEIWLLLWVILTKFDYLMEIYQNFCECANTR